ncbi:restriction endonuclease subunit S [Vibrio sp. 10N.222.52.C3]|uniref:restriction endonuclease subunit S n=1 Tax=Vibrio sp. 10N.222.52.C3 TaxID=3229631 RepID=UPI00354B03CC
MGSEWVATTLGDIALGRDGAVDGPFGSNLPASCYQDVGIPVVRGSNLSVGLGEFKDDGFVYVSDSTFDKLSRSECKAGDIVFTKKGTLGQTGLITSEHKFDRYLLSSNQMRLRVDPTKAIPEYVYFCVSSKKTILKLIKDSESTGVPKINLAYLKSIQIELPSIEIQKEIIGHLGALNSKITLNNQINQTLEQMAQAIFKSWFVDFDPVKAKMNGEQPKGMDAPFLSKEVASLFPEKLVESELGLIPEGWEASKLENLVDIASSKRVFAKEYLEEGVPFYRGKEITELSKGNSVTPEIYISEERYQELKDKAGAPKEGDILITSVGTIGNTYLVDSDDKFYFKDGNLTWVKDYKGEEIPYFLMEWFKSAVGKCAIENIKIGSTQQAITIKSLNGIKLVNPSNDVHKNFTKLIEPLYRKHRANIKQSKALANLRDTLLPKLLSGEIDLENVQVEQAKALAE